MIRYVALATAGLLLGLAPTQSWSSAVAKPRFSHLAPVLVVEEVEPCVRFWVDRLGFVKENELVGADGKPMFASVAKDGVEVMYQTRASVLADSADKAAAAEELEGHSIALFIDVDDLDAIEKAVTGAPVVKARHRTSYGTSELYIKEPGGNTVGFAQKQ